MAGRRLAKLHGGGTLGEHARAGFARFTGPQVRVIVAYLWWRLDRHGYRDITIEQALEHYWLEREAAASGQ